MGLIIGILVGALSGWIAGNIMHSKRSLFGNIILGIVGSFVGTAVLNLVGIHGSGMIGNIIVSVVGACIVIYIGRALS